MRLEEEGRKCRAARMELLAEMGERQRLAAMALWRQAGRRKRRGRRRREQDVAVSRRRRAVGGGGRATKRTEAAGHSRVGER